MRLRILARVLPVVLPLLCGSCGKANPDLDYAEVTSYPVCYSHAADSTFRNLTVELEMTETDNSKIAMRWDSTCADSLFAHRMRCPEDGVKLSFKNLKHKQMFLDSCSMTVLLCCNQHYTNGSVLRDTFYNVTWLVTKSDEDSVQSSTHSLRVVSGKAILSPSW